VEIWSHNMDDNSIVIMRHHHFRMLGFHLRFYFGVLKLASALYMFCQISEILGKKVKSGQLLAYFCSTFGQLLAVQSEINAGIIRVSEVYQKTGQFLRIKRKNGAAPNQHEISRN